MPSIGALRLILISYYITAMIIDWEGGRVLDKSTLLLLLLLAARSVGRCGRVRGRGFEEVEEERFESGCCRAGQRQQAALAAGGQ